MTDDAALLREALAARYALEDVIGRGGMATVYRARDLKHGRKVAVKVLRSDLAQSIGPERFLKEIEIAARLAHPHILPLFDSGQAGEAPDEVFLYYVMPFVDGESLRILLNRVRLMDVDGALAITRRVADALDYAHRQGVVHRDIKPENILLPDGHAVVADFGIAKAVSSAATGALTKTGIALGTPGYMSPEQAAGVNDLDGRTDVYSLGAVTYEMLMGDLPRIWLTHEAQTAGKFLDASRAHRTILDRLPGGLELALTRALALRAEDRFATPGEFAFALEHPDQVAPVRSTGSMSSLVPVRRSVAPATRHTAPAPLDQSGFLGAPSVLTVERVVDGEVPEEEYDALLSEIRATFARQGHETVSGRSLIWTARQPTRPFNMDPDGKPGREFRAQIIIGAVNRRGDRGAPHVVVRVVSRNGRTRITVEERLAEQAGGIYGGILGFGGTGLIATIFTVGAQVMHAAPGPVIGLAAAAAGATYVLSRSIYRAVVSHHAATLERLADRLADHCEEAAGNK